MCNLKEFAIAAVAYVKVNIIYLFMHFQCAKFQ